MVLGNQSAQFQRFEAQEHYVGRAKACVVDCPSAVIDQQSYVAIQACDIGCTKTQTRCHILLWATHGGKELAEVFLKLTDALERRQLFSCLFDSFADLIKVCLVDAGKSFFNERAQRRPSPSCQITFCVTKSW